MQYLTPKTFQDPFFSCQIPTPALFAIICYKLTLSKLFKHSTIKHDSILWEKEGFQTKWLYVSVFIIQD